MKYFQPNQPARRSAGKLTRRGENLPDIIEKEIFDAEIIRIESLPATSERREDSGHVRAIGPGVIEEVRKESATRPTPPPAPGPTPVAPEPPEPQREREPQQQNAAASFFSRLVKMGGWGFALAAILILIVSNLFGGGETGTEGPAGVTETPATATTGIRKLDTPAGGRVLPAGAYVILAEKEWSEPVSVPLGGDLRWSSVRSGVKYQVETAAGEVFDFPRTNNEYFHLPNGGFVRFRSAQETPAEIRVTVLHRR